MSMVKADLNIFFAPLKTAQNFAKWCTWKMVVKKTTLAIQKFKIKYTTWTNGDAQYNLGRTGAKINSRFFASLSMCFIFSWWQHFFSLRSTWEGQGCEFVSFAPPPRIIGDVKNVILEEILYFWMQNKVPNGFLKRDKNLDDIISNTNSFKDFVWG